jgi:hypothetical protein
VEWRVRRDGAVTTVESGSNVPSFSEACALAPEAIDAGAGVLVGRAEAQADTPGGDAFAERVGAELAVPVATEVARLAVARERGVGDGGHVVSGVAACERTPGERHAGGALEHDRERERGGPEKRWISVRSRCQTW